MSNLTPAAPKTGTEAGDVATLQYSPRRGSRHRTHLRVAVLATVVLVVLAAWYWWRPVRDRIVFEYRLSQCMEHAPPPDQPVYDEDWVRAPVLLTRPDYRPTVRLLLNYPGVSPSGFSGPACYLPPALAALDPTRTPGVAYLHGRRLPGSPRRLVVVECAPSGFGPDGHIIILRGRLASPDPATSSLSFGRRVPGSLILKVAGDERLRLFAGQSDPADESHFAIRYELGGRRGTIDGWLRPPGPTGTGAATKPGVTGLGGLAFARSAYNAKPTESDWVELKVSD